MIERRCREVRWEKNGMMGSSHDVQGRGLTTLGQPIDTPSRASLSMTSDMKDNTRMLYASEKDY